jgi:hypothetical protein
MSLPFPVMMIVGVVVGKKMYSLLKYLFTMLIAPLSMFKDKAGKASGGSDSLVGVGEVLLHVYLITSCDSLAGAVQEWMKLEHQTKSGLMIAMHKWSVDYLSVALAIHSEC